MFGSFDQSEPNMMNSNHGRLPDSNHFIHTLLWFPQPDNGIPVLGFRGDPDDRLLLEAVLPLLQVGGTRTIIEGGRET